mmetsp:Transcript_19378/g.32919  ORF Transcript_19378/g.32919 Transcript_19378/m.32919 type:complete len:135 (+) Transcript_19378:93-497(+)
MGTPPPPSSPPLTLVLSQPPPPPAGVVLSPIASLGILTGLVTLITLFFFVMEQVLTRRRERLLAHQRAQDDEHLAAVKRLTMAAGMDSDHRGQSFSDPSNEPTTAEKDGSGGDEINEAFLMGLGAAGGAGGGRR